MALWRSSASCLALKLTNGLTLPLYACGAQQDTYLMGCFLYVPEAFHPSLGIYSLDFWVAQTPVVIDIHVVKCFLHKSCCCVCFCYADRFFKSVVCHSENVIWWKSNKAHAPASTLFHALSHLQRRFLFVIPFIGQLFHTDAAQCWISSREQCLLSTLACFSSSVTIFRPSTTDFQFDTSQRWYKFIPSVIQHLVLISHSATVQFFLWFITMLVYRSKLKQPYTWSFIKSKVMKTIF